MRAVWKFAILPDEFRISMPRGALILSVGVQNGAPVFWALVDPDAPKVDRRLMTVGTGHAHPDEFWKGWRSIGVVGPLHGALWFHLFDGGEPVTELTDVDVTHVSIGKDGKLGIGGVVRESREVHQFPGLDLVARATFRTFEKCHAVVTQPTGPDGIPNGPLVFELPATADSGDQPVRIELHLADLSVHHGMDIGRLLEVDPLGPVVLVDGRTLETFILDARRRTANAAARGRRSGTSELIPTNKPGVGVERPGEFDRVRSSDRGREIDLESEAADANAFAREWEGLEDEDSSDLPGDPDIGD